MTGYIYAITNTVSGKQYIGKTSRDIETRWKEHIGDLNCNRHRNRYLQRVANKYGVQVFTFAVIEEPTIPQLNEREIALIAQYGTFGNGYNLTKGGEGILGLKHTDEAKRKMSEVSAVLTESEVTAIYLNTTDIQLTLSKNYNVCYETIRNIQSGVSFNYITAQLPLHPRHKALIEGSGRVANGKTASRKIARLTLNGDLMCVYENGQEPALDGFDIKHVNKCCRGTRKSHKKHRFMYYDDYLARKTKKS